MGTTLDKFGRVVIPKEIRDGLGLKPGEALQVKRVEDEVILKPLREESPIHIKNGILVFSGTVTGDIREVVRIHRKERLKKIISLKTK